MYSRDPFNLRKTPASALTLLQTAAAKTLETSSAAVHATKQTLEDADMSFAIPRNVPDFNDAQRRFEDNVWSKFSGNEKGLPMYKDKPAYYGGRRGVKRWCRGKRGVGLVVLVVFGVLYWLGWLSGGKRVGDGVEKKEGWGSILGSGGAGKKGVDWEKRRESVRDAFLLSWNAYEEHGWGRSYYSPARWQLCLQEYR